MNHFIQYTVGAIVVVSVVGAVGLALVVLRYGYMPPFDESARSARHALLTRFSHGLAAACLMLSAVLGILTLSVASTKARGESAPSRSDVAFVENLLSLDTRVKGMEKGLRDIDASLGKVLSRLEEVERRR